MEIFYIENSTDESLTFSMICNDDIKYDMNLDVYRNEIFLTIIKKLRARSNSKFPVAPEGKIIIMDCEMNILIGALEKFQRILNNFIVYDAEGNIILTMDDINENTFITYEVINIEYVIKITPDIVEAGRMKYAGRKE
jgi:hypothetical protein